MKVYLSISNSGSFLITMLIFIEYQTLAFRHCSKLMYSNIVESVSSVSISLNFIKNLFKYKGNKLIIRSSENIKFWLVLPFWGLKDNEKKVAKVLATCLSKWTRSRSIFYETICGTAKFEFYKFTSTKEGSAFLEVVKTHIITHITLT